MNKRIITALFLFFPCAAALRAEQAVISVTQIEFRGLKYVSKAEIMKGVNVKTSGKEIILDLGSLKTSLAGISFIENYRLGQEKGSLIITVSEKIPSMIIVIENNGTLVPMELDSDFRIISRDGIHAGDLPAVFMTQGEDREKSDAALKKVHALLKNIQKTKPSLYREISEIYLTDEQLKIILHGRRTAFFLRPDEKQMSLLACAVGWLDRKGYYPAKMIISGNRALMR